MSDLFKVRDHIENFEWYPAEFARRNVVTAETLRSERNVPYGDGPAERLDLFFPAGDALAPRPIHMFIHGGYWRAYSKDDFLFVADGIVAAGAVAAIVDYSLMPAARMKTLVEQVRRACAWLSANATSFGGDAARLSVSGHSAGGHLAVMACAPGQDYRIRSALAVSGLYDLAPLAASFLQQEVRFTPDEIELFAPLNLSFDQDVIYDLMVGAEETAPFHGQADSFAERLRGQGAKVMRSTIEGDHHMSIVLNMGTPGSVAAKHLERCIAG